jgi:hypothetical protein
MSTSLSLYAVEDDLQALLTTEEGMAPEDEEQRVAILTEIAQTHGAAVAKRDRVAHVCLALEHRDDAVDSELARLQELKQKWAREKKRFHNYIIDVLEKYAPADKRGVKRLVGNTSELSLAKNPDSTEVWDEKLVPLHLCETTIKMTGAQYSALLDNLVAAELKQEAFLLASSSASVPRKAEIKKAIKAGVKVPGASLKPESKRLVVK